MKLFTRIKIAYVLIFVVPITLILASFCSVAFQSMTVMERTYGVEMSGWDMLNPTKILGRMTSAIAEELRQAIEETPEDLEDLSYLEDVNGRLEENSSYLLVRKDGAKFYSGLPEDSNFNENLSYQNQKENQESIYVLNEMPYHIQEMTFVFADGSNGQALIYTNVNQLFPLIKQMMMRFVVLSILILFCVSAIATMWLYKSIVKPLDKLKAAANNVANGNLNFTITSETDDEVGELCDAFEGMRIKLKNQIDLNMQYEKESKELISNISHDLKTPITAIKGYVEGIRDGVADTPEKMDKYIRTIYNKAADMDKLIDELFLYAKLDSNSVNYSFTKVNLNDYFEDCIDEISLDLESQGIDLGFFNYTDKKTIVIADPEQLKRVINNIIGNSVKYLGDRKGIINVRIMEEPEFVKIEIEDNGKGIAKDELPFIFDRCYRTDSSRNSSKGGSGLGLSIAKKIIEEHGGKIWAVSTEGVGTTMCFVLRKYKENGVYE